MHAEGEVLDSKEDFLEKVIGNYRVLVISLGSPLTIDFHRLGTEGFPWPEIKACIDNKWPFVLTPEKLTYLLDGHRTIEVESNYQLVQDVKHALHRNQRRLDCVEGIYEGSKCPVNAYTLTNHDNVIVYIQGMVKEIQYLPKK